MLNWLKRSTEEYDPVNDEKFADRADAGRALVRALQEYTGRNVIVLAIPRGGIEAAWWLKTYLKTQWSVLVANKLHLPDNDQMGIGAVAEDGSTYIDPSAQQHVSDMHIATMKSLEQLEVNRRLGVFRKGAPIPDMKEKTVILVDDGIAMGCTMRVAIALCRKRGAGEIIVAAPVAPARVVKELEEIADKVVVLRIPKEFRSVRQVYEKFNRLTDDDVWDVINRKAPPQPQPAAVQADSPQNPQQYS